MKYKRADNCGPVPYPDGSGRMLTDEVAEGDGWEALVALGFVVRVEEKTGKRLPEASKPKASRTRVTKPNKAKNTPVSNDAGETIGKNDIVNTSDNAGVVNGINDRDGADGLDSAQTRSADSEDSVG